MVPLLLAFFFLLVFALFAVLADRVLRNARWGDCWTYSVPRWFKHGGYLSLRPSDGIALFGVIGIPHAIWQAGLGGALRMTPPLDRNKAMIFPAHLMLFAFEVWHGDGPHAADWMPSAAP